MRAEAEEGAEGGRAADGGESSACFGRTRSVTVDDLDLDQAVAGRVLHRSHSSKKRRRRQVRRR